MANEKSIYVKHNMEIAHRLYLQPGKCQQIHGHSMQIRLTLKGQVDQNGIFASIDFSDLKKLFRGWIDLHYDHHLLLNRDDPWAQELYMFDGKLSQLPGLNRLPGDPTTENLAMWICDEMRENILWAYKANQTSMLNWIEIDITETGTNGASFGRNM